MSIYKLLSKFYNSPTGSPTSTLCQLHSNHPLQLLSLKKFLYVNMESYISTISILHVSKITYII